MQIFTNASQFHPNINWFFATCLNQECLLYKPTVLGGPTDKDPKDWGQQMCRPWNLSVLTKKVYMDFFPPLVYSEVTASKVCISIFESSYRWTKNIYFLMINWFRLSRPVLWMILFFRLDDCGVILRNNLDVSPLSVCRIFRGGPSSTFQHCGREEWGGGAGIWTST